MKNKLGLTHVKLLFWRLGIVFFVFFILRILFIALNSSLFADATFTDYIKSFFYGARFDISIIAYINGLIIVMHVIPFKFRGNKTYQKILKILFYLFNIIAILIMVSDLVFFKFNFKRITIDVFSLASSIPVLLKQFLIDYWYLTLIFAGIIVLMEFLYRKCKPELNNFKHNYIVQSIYFLAIIALTVIAMRGGIQKRPIKPYFASKYLTPALSPLITNSAFTFIHSFDGRILEEKHFYELEEAKKIYPIHFNSQTQDSLKTPNVVIIILESFSKEYVGFYNNGKGFTPNLDTILSQSLAFSNAFANGVRSNQGLIALTGGIPSIMEEPFLHSSYVNNRIYGLGEIFNNLGYETSFFNGSSIKMLTWDEFIKCVDIKEFFGREKFNNEKEFDGNWGIYDHPFFKFFADKLDEYNKPFFSVFFSLSSRHPFPVHPDFKDRFNKSTDPFLNSMEYADYSLGEFFRIAKTKKWFKNTLFIITADHTYGSDWSNPDENKKLFYRNRAGIYSIPFCYYFPGDTLFRGINQNITQQIDVLPTLLDYINYKGEYTSFGKSIFETDTTRFSYQYINNLYQIIYKNYILLFDGNEVVGMYDYIGNSDFSVDIKNDVKYSKIREIMEKQIKAIVQVYNYGMIYNAISPFTAGKLK